MAVALHSISSVAAHAVERHGGDDAVGAGPGDAHGRAVQADNPGLYGGVAQQGRRLLLVVGDDLPAVLLQQIPGVGGALAVDSLLKELSVHLVGFLDEGDLLRRHAHRVIVDLLQGVGMDIRRMVPAMFPGLLLP